MGKRRSKSRPAISRNCWTSFHATTQASNPRSSAASLSRLTALFTARRGSRKSDQKVKLSLCRTWQGGRISRISDELAKRCSPSFGEGLGSIRPRRVTKNVAQILDRYVRQFCLCLKRCPEAPFGGPRKNQLFINAMASLYAVDLTTIGIQSPLALNTSVILLLPWNKLL